MKLSIKIAATWLGYLGFVCSASAELANDTYRVSVPEDGIPLGQSGRGELPFQAVLHRPVQREEPQSGIALGGFFGRSSKAPLQRDDWATGKVATDNKTCLTADMSKTVLIQK